MANLKQGDFPAVAACPSCGRPVPLKWVPDKDMGMGWCSPCKRSVIKSGESIYRDHRYELRRRLELARLEEQKALRLRVQKLIDELS